MDRSFQCYQCRFSCTSKKHGIWNPDACFVNAKLMHIAEHEEVEHGRRWAVKPVAWMTMTTGCTSALLGVYTRRGTSAWDPFCSDLITMQSDFRAGLDSVRWTVERKVVGF